MATNETQYSQFFQILPNKINKTLFIHHLLPQMLWKETENYKQVPVFQELIISLIKKLDYRC